jgi:hypothetical protein
VDKTPPFTILVKQLCDPVVCETIPQVIDLLYWLLVELKDIQMKSVPKSEVMLIKSLDVYYNDGPAYFGDTNRNNVSSSPAAQQQKTETGV